MNERSFRQSRRDIDVALDQLDKQAQSSAKQTTRRSARRRFRDMLRVELEQPGGAVMCYAAATRNVSPNGIGFLLGQFVYPRSRCRVHLIGPNGEWRVIKGTVVRCRYLPGTLSLHEVGVRFDEAIDTAMLEEDTGQSRSRRVLFADDDRMSHQLVGHFLKDLNIELTCVESGAAAVEAASSGDYDLILIDLEMPDTDGLSAVKTLRARGYSSPIVVVTASQGERTQQDCLDAGCNGFLSKPVSRETLVRTVTGLARGPLVSSLADQPEMTELINQFVASLPEKVERLQSAFSAQDYTTVEALARLLRGAGSSYGFALITNLATELEGVLQAQAAAEAIRESLEQLVRWCQAARPVADLPRE